MNTVNPGQKRADGQAERDATGTQQNGDGWMGQLAGGRAGGRVALKSERTDKKEKEETLSYLTTKLSACGWRRILHVADGRLRT